MINNIPVDQQEIKNMLDLAQRRYTRASQNAEPWMQQAVRFLKIYRQMQDAVHDSDEPNTFLPYAFGLVEQIVYKMSEPVLKMVPPCRVLPKKFGHDQQAFKFEQKARNFYTSSEYQLNYINSCSEQVILGSAWEMDSWHQEYSSGRRWVNAEQKGEMPTMMGMDVKPVPLK